jgi:LPPG:FO 2-phospho-L-lactate transferase
VVVVLAGGTGGAKLARGLLDVVGPGELAVIANTGDDVEVYGVHVSPDPDLVTYWLADAIDERGYGIRDDTWEVMEALERADRDLAMCLLRTELMRGGERLTVAHQAVVRALGVEARVLPMSDEPVRAHVITGQRSLPFQEFMVRERAALPIDGVELAGIEHARPTPEALAAIESADSIVIGPSNPVISIGPILAVPGLRAALEAAAAPVVAMSPFVGGRAVKGPTDAFCEHAGIALGADGIAGAYDGLVHGIVADDAADAPVPVLEVDTLMDNAESRREVARSTLDFAASLSR